MTDLVSDTPPVAQSPKRKFSFRFPNLSHHSSIEKDGAGTASGAASHNGSASGATGSTTALSYTSHKNRNFSEELNNLPDLQVSAITHVYMVESNTY